MISQLQMVSARWLASQQDRESGGWSDRPGGDVNVLNTAESVIALTEAVSDSLIEIEASHDIIQNGINYLLSSDNRITEGADAGAWPRFVEHQENGEDVQRTKCADLIRTATALEAVIGWQRSIDAPIVRQGLCWLLKRQGTDDGGFRFTDASRSEILPTCYAVTALIRACKTNLRQTADLQSAIKHGLNFIKSQRNPDGSVGRESELRAATTILSALTNELALNFGGDATLVKDAVNWLKRNAHEATKPMRIEAMANDPFGSGKYDLVVMTDTLLVRLLTRSGHQKSPLAEAALISMHQRIDESGGCFGSLMYTWATAKVMSALHVAKSEFQDIPKQEATTTQSRQLAGHFVYALVVLLTLAVFVLILLGSSIPFWLPPFATFLVLAVLLSYGILNQNSFVLLVKKLLRKPGKDADDP